MSDLESADMLGQKILELMKDVNASDQTALSTLLGVTAMIMGANFCPSCRRCLMEEFGQRVLADANDIAAMMAREGRSFTCHGLSAPGTTQAIRW